MRLNLQYSRSSTRAHTSSQSFLGPYRLEMNVSGKSLRHSYLEFRERTATLLRCAFLIHGFWRDAF